MINQSLCLFCSNSSCHHGHISGMIVLCCTRFVQYPLSSSSVLFTSSDNKCSVGYIARGSKPLIRNKNIIERKFDYESNN